VRSKCTNRFWKLHYALPADVRARARKSYDLWKRDHSHPSLDFKKLKGGAGNRFSIRVGDHHRAIGQLEGDVVKSIREDP
jgi:plasmid maintenance system killer protein